MKSDRIFVLSVLATAALATGWSATASADPYIVEICTPAARASDAIFGPFQEGGNPLSIFDFNCDPPSQEVIYQGSNGGAVARGSGEYWELRAPEGTRIDSLEFDRVFRDTDFTFLNWELKTGGGALLEAVSDDEPLPVKSHKNYPVNSAAVRGYVICPTGTALPPCASKPGNPAFEVELKNLRAILDDPVPPTVARPEPVAAPARGTTEVSVSATDVGSGINEVTLFVDGVKLAGHHDENGGKCRPTYRFVVPCKPQITTSFPLDTTKLANGPHELFATASDAAGLLNGSPSTTFTVDNSPPAPADTTAPLLTKVSLSRKRLSLAKGKKSGTSLRFTTDEGGKLTIAVERSGKGKKPKRVLSVLTTVTAGRGVIPLGGKIAAKHLRAGGYRVSVTVQDVAGNVSKPVRVPLKVLGH